MHLRLASVPVRIYIFNSNMQWNFIYLLRNDECNRIWIYWPCSRLAVAVDWIFLFACSCASARLLEASRQYERSLDASMPCARAQFIRRTIFNAGKIERQQDAMMTWSA
ncbi:hypothetical protein BS78_08G046000 [Paspalum vaginatum]|nr:hypothetical protein BS78_08G046000 [Paspalum vaginatum]